MRRHGRPGVTSDLHGPRRRIGAMLATDARSAAKTWRPQEFGGKRASSVPDPIVEPLWTGPRVLALIANGDAILTDADGEVVTRDDAPRDALLEASRGSTILVEGTLTPEPLQRLDDLAPRDGVAVPTPGRMARQMLIGDRGDRKDRLAAHVEALERRARIDPFAEVAFVAVDLIWLDDDSLCDVPLLERKRILESVLAESRLVRLGAFVKPPIDRWIGSWRTLGFRRIAFKAANSRYIPGSRNPDWALADLPRR